MRKQNSLHELPFNNSTVCEYERALLGSYLMGADIGRGITPSVFYRGANGIVFQTIRGLRERGISPDILVVVSELQKNGRIDAAGGAACIAELTNCVPTPGNVSFYETQVLDAYRARAAWAALTKAKEALENNADVSGAADTLSATLEMIGMNEGSGDRGATPVLFSDLLKERFPPKRFFIERILTPGLTVFAGASKSGKSWLCLQICHAIDAGGFFLGALRVEQTSVLYFSLEDGKEAIFHRLQKQDNTAFSTSYLATEKMTFKELSAFLDRNRQVKVILIDTWQKFAGVPDSNDYALNVDTAGQLKTIAERHEAAIIVIAHLRKNQLESGDHLNDTLGSIGLNASADGIWTLRRKRGEGTARFLVSGRNIEDTEFSLRWDKDMASWTITDAGDLKPVLPDAQRQIIDLLESEARDWTTAEIVEATGKSYGAIGNLLKRLQENGLIESSKRGHWSAKSNITCSPSLRECENVIKFDPPKTTMAAEDGELPIW
jgi:hypothetical protein